MWGGNLNSLGYSVLVLVVVVVVLAVEFRLFIMPKTMLGGGVAVERGGVHNMPEMSVCCHVVAIVQTVLLAAVVVVVVVVLVVVLTFILTPTATAYANNYATNNDDGQQ